MWFSFIGVSFPCLVVQAAFRFEFAKGYAYLISISTLFDYSSTVVIGYARGKLTLPRYV